MIQANELRYGNLLYDGDENIVIVESVGKNGVNLYYNPNKGNIGIECSYHWYQLQSIQLTQKWIDKFDLTYYNLYGWYLLNGDEENGICASFNEGIFSVGLVTPVIFIDIAKIKHVHHLQNFLYYLTGTELTLNTES